MSVLCVRSSRDSTTCRRLSRIPPTTSRQSQERARPHLKSRKQKPPAAFIHLLGMVRRCTEIGLKECLSGWSRKGPAGGFQGHKHRVDFFEQLRIVELHGPAMLGLVIVIKDSETVRRFAIQVVAIAPPCRIHKLPVCSILRR